MNQCNNSGLILILVLSKFVKPDKDEEERDDDDLDDEEGNHMAARSNLRHRDAGFNFSGNIVYKEQYFRV